MVNNKHISKIIIGLMAIAVAICILACAFSEKLIASFGGIGVRMEYEEKLFNTDEVMEVNITMDPDEWETMLDNALSEEYYTCDVVVNGETVKNVAIRPKGNTSLSAIAMDPTTDRFSLKLEFDHFVDGQTCYGLDKLILNNNYADATNMKEAVIYDMYQFIGADASLYNYAKVYINGEYWGVYLALEGVEESFMLRNFGTQDGDLYKPDSMEMTADNTSEEEFTFGGGGFAKSRGGANLNYTDDELDNYATIWEGEITKSGKKDHARVVNSLKNISEGTNLEKYMDVDNLLRYMAVHTFSVNMDSLSGSMAHNYYLYEYKGQLNILPWDYNLSFGGMSMTMGTSSTAARDMINDAIDDPFQSTKFFDKLLENEEYLAKYHEYLQKLVDEYVYGGRFDEVYSRIRSQIDSLVDTDPTAFYTYDEYEAAVEMLYKTIQLRAESIDGQLKGSIPSTEIAQRNDRSSLIDASEIDISVMGTFSMGGGGGGPQNTSTEPAESTAEVTEKYMTVSAFAALDENEEADPTDETEKQKTGDGNQPPQGGPGGQGGFTPGDTPPDMGDFDPGNMPDMGDFDPGNVPDMGDFNPDDLPEDFDPGNLPNNGGFNASDKPSNFMNSSTNTKSGLFDSTLAKNLLTYGICLVIAVVGLVFVTLYKRRK